MRHLIPLFLTAATVLVGCHSTPPVSSPKPTPVVAAPPPFRPQLITTLGTHTSPDGAWRIKISEHSLDVSHSTDYNDGKGLASSGWVTTHFGTASPWTAHAGWFVYLESVSRAWVFDGDHELLLQTETSNGVAFAGASYGNHYPGAVPTEVFSRLPESVQKSIRTRE